MIARAGGDFITVERERVEYMDISPKQLVSVAAALIPFLEHDDANRALMGSNMQRQAVPLLRSDSPIVGTGLEGTVARDSGAVVSARRAGVIDIVDAERIIVRVEGEDPETGEAKEFGADIYSANQIPALQPEHLHQSEAGDRAGRNAGQEGRRAGRRSLAPRTASWRSAATC